MSDVTTLLQAGESETVELKERWNDAALEAVAAFANTRGGTLLVGVTDQGQIVGWPGTDGDLRGIASQVADTLLIHPSLTVDTEPEQRVLVVDVAKSATPVACRGRYYRRVGNTTREVPRDEIARFWATRTGARWDNLPGEYSLDEIDEETVRDFLRLARKRLPAVRPDEDVAVVLQKLQLLADGKLTRGAILLFGKDPQQHFITARIHMGRFKDPMRVVDDKFITGNLFKQVQEAMRLFEQYLQVRFEFHHEVGDRTMMEALQREEIWDYPLDALREAVVNALIHRDYFAGGADVHVRVHDDRVIVTNPGELPEGMTAEALRHYGHDSVLRNPSLAQVFYYAELVEGWGTGTTKMIELCQAQGVPEPDYRPRPAWFEVVFSQDAYTEDRLRRMGLSERQVKAVRWVKEKGQISNGEYQELHKVARRTATRELGDLVQRGILEQVGRVGQGTEYHLRGAPNAPIAP